MRTSTFRRSSVLACALVLGCGGPISMCPDGSEPVDGECPEPDSGPPASDAGPQPDPDAGEPSSDAGMGEPDSGMEELDAGPIEPSDGGCVPRAWFADGDGDGYGNPAIQVELCSAPAGFVDDSSDCDDGCATCNPGEAEVCDGEDNDCDATPDDGVLVTFYRDGDGDGHGTSATSMQACSAPSGFVASSDDCDDGCGTCYPGSAEVCDGEDNDCDGTADDGVTTVYYRDADNDGYGTNSDTRTACSAPSGYIAVGGDCNDGAATISPGDTEVCNGIDDDCSGAADQTFACVRDTPVSCNTVCGSTGSALCSSSCTVPSGASCSPPAETCNGIDDDCDGAADDNVLTVGAPLVSAYAADFGRPEASAGPSVLFSFWEAAGTVSAWRHQHTGEPLATAQVPLGGTENYDADVGGFVVWAYVNASGNAVVQRLDAATLSAVWTQTVPVTATQVQVAAGTDYAFLFTREANGEIYRRALARTGGTYSGAELVGATLQPFELAHDAVDRQLLVTTGPTAFDQVNVILMRGTATPSVISTRSAAAPNPISHVAVASPWGASADPDVVVAYTTSGSSASQFSTRYVSWRAGFSAHTGAINAMAAARGGGAGRSVIDLEYANGSYLLAGTFTSTAPVPASGTPGLYQLVRRATSAQIDSYSIPLGLPVATHESLSLVTYPAGASAPHRLFYNPSVNGIASLPIGCL
jgi:hypothetical protein